MQREYEEFKVRINAIVANSRKVPEGGWSLPEGGPWQGNNVQDHAGMVQVGYFFLYLSAPFYSSISFLI